MSPPETALVLGVFRLRARRTEPQRAREVRREKYKDIADHGSSAVRTSRRPERWGAGFVALARKWGIVTLPALLQSLPLLWKTPLSHDHPAHLFKAWHFWTEMIGRGRLRGWSHFWGFGFPSDELVPSGGELWVCLFRVLSLGQLSWTRTYALAFAGFLVFKAVAVYAFARRSFAHGAAVAAAWITCLDVGAFSEGGWVWNTEWGVWPVSLSMCLILMAFVEVDRVLLTGRARHVLGAGVAAAWALLAHQIALLVLVVAIPLLLVDRVLSAQRPRSFRLLQACAAVALGFALSAFTLIPFLARAGYAMDLGVATTSLAQVLGKLLTLRTFARLSPLIHGLAIVGGWLALRQRRPQALFLCASAAAFVVLSSDLLTAVLHLERVFPSVIKIESPRMLLVAKLFWFPLAGHAIAWALSRARLPWQPESGSSTAIRRGLQVALLAAIVLPGLPRLYDAEVAKNIQGEAETPHFTDLEQAFAWAQAVRQREPGLYRIAYELGRDDHTSTLAPLYGGAPMYKIGDTPSQIFDGMPMTDGPEMLEALSVRYLVSHHRRDEPYFTHERSFGALELYRFERYRAEPFELEGSGRAELIEWGPERIRVRLQDTHADSRLRLHVAAYERWQATQGHVPLAITRVTVHGAEDPVLMELPARDGELLLEYVDGPPDRLGLIVSLSALPMFAGLWLVGPRPWRAVLGAAAGRRRPIAWGGAALACVAALLIAHRVARAGALLPSRSIFYSDVELSLAGEPCIKRGELVFACGPHRVEAKLVHGRGDHLCMAAPEVGTLRVRSRVRLGAFVAGRYDARGFPGWLEATLDGRELGWVWTRPGYMRAQSVQFDVRARGGEPGALELSLSGGALRCFDFWLL